MVLFFKAFRDLLLSKEVLQSQNKGSFHVFRIGLSLLDVCRIVLWSHLKVPVLLLFHASVQHMKEVKQSKVMKGINKIKQIRQIKNDKHKSNQVNKKTLKKYILM